MKTQLEQIYKSGIAMLETLDLNLVYPLILNESLSFTKGFDGLLVFKTKYSYKIACSSKKHNLQLPSKFMSKLFANSSEIVIYKRSDFKPLPPLFEKDIHSLIAIPLPLSHKQFGFLIIRSKKQNPISIRDISFLKLYASLASSALKKAQYYSEMKKALQLRDTFISMAAHELRTPLTSIHGYAQLLAHKNRGVKLKDAQGKWINSLYEESTRLTNLLSDLLSVNRIKTGELQYLFDQIRISEIVNEAILKVKKKYMHDIEFQNGVLKNDDFIIGDKLRLMQVFEYLIENGITHTKNKEPIEVTMIERSSHYVVSITDYGSGIEKKDIAQILDGFYKKVEGKGFGVKLFLSNNIIKQHNGILTIESEKDRGTTVFVKLPKLKPSFN